MKDSAALKTRLIEIASQVSSEEKNTAIENILKLVKDLDEEKTS